MANEKRAIENVETRLPAYIPSTPAETAKVGLTGAGVGLLVVGLSELIARYFIEPVFCRSADSFAICSNGGNVAFYSATVIMAMIAIVVLVRLGVFRPLLIAVGSAAILWGLKSRLEALSFVEYALWLVGLYAVSYTVLFWLLRVRNFAVSFAFVLLVVVLARLTIT